MARKQLGAAPSGTADATTKGYVDSAVTTAVTTATTGMVTLTGTQSLSNKTLTSPTLVTPVLGTPSSGSVVNCTGQVCDMSLVVFAASTTRATGTGDFPFGVRLMRNAYFNLIYYRCLTADASGNLVVELRKNGATVSGSSATIAAASQVTGTSVSGAFSFSGGDIITVYVTGIGTTPGKGLVVELGGVTT